jgi:glycerophosphoryl diester phosphodiesterase
MNSVDTTADLQPGALTPLVNGRRRTFVCHRCRLSGRHPDNSLAALDECLGAAAPRVEIDVHAIRPDLFVVHHDEAIDGMALDAWFADRDREAARELSPSGAARFTLLEDIVERVAPGDTFLQVDLKTGRLLDDEDAEALAELLAPLGSRVVVGSQFHWNVRCLARRGIPVALDPFLTIHCWPRRPPGPWFPRQPGNFGFWDDSPLAVRTDIPGRAYVEQRLDDLAGMVPGMVELMIDYRTLVAMLDCGADPDAVLGPRGIELTTWTLREEELEDPDALLHYLMDAGVSNIISDDPGLFAARARNGHGVTKLSLTRPG